MSELTNTQPLWELSYAPTAEELYIALRSGETRKASKTRLIVQSVILAAVALWCVLPLFFGGKGDVMLAGVAVAVCVAMWLVPPLKMKADAKNAAAVEQRVCMRVYAQGLSFGQGETVTEIPFAEITCYQAPEQLTLAIRQELVPVPYRVLSEECRQFLAENCKEKIHE